MKKSTEKIKISANDYKISEVQSNITRTVDVMKNILQLWKEEGVKFSDIEINSLIQSSFGEITCNTIATERSQHLAKKDQLEEFASIKDDINLFGRLYPGLRMVLLSGYVYCEGGEIQVKKGAFEEVEEIYTYYITEQKDIVLYKRHQQIINDLNELCNDIKTNVNPHINASYLIKFDVDNNAVLPALRYGNN